MITEKQLEHKICNTKDNRTERSQSQVENLSKILENVKLFNEPILELRLLILEFGGPVHKFMHGCGPASLAPIRAGSIGRRKSQGRMLASWPTPDQGPIWSGLFG